jgi:hypothetical protein
MKINSILFVFTCHNKIIKNLIYSLFSIFKSSAVPRRVLIFNKIKENFKFDQLVDQQLYE